MKKLSDERKIYNCDERNNGNKFMMAKKDETKMR
jgi:hypothetical protein